MTDSTTKSARRVMEILEAFERAQHPLSLKVICDELTYPPSSGLALLKSLVTLGYLGYDKVSRTYLPTMRISVIGQWVPEQLFSRFNLIKIMEKLRDETGHTTFVGTRSDLHAQYTHIAYAERLTNGNVPPGTLRPLESCGFGHLFLSQLSENELRHTIRRINIKHCDPTKKIKYEDLEHKLRQVRADGYVLSRLSHFDGLSVVAMLLPEAIFGRTLGIGLGGSSEDLEENLQDVLASLRGANDAIQFAGHCVAERPPAVIRSVFGGEIRPGATTSPIFGAAADVDRTAGHV